MGCSEAGSGGGGARAGIAACHGACRRGDHTACCTADVAQCRGTDVASCCSADVAACDMSSLNCRHASNWHHASSSRSVLSWQIREKRSFGFSDITALHSFFQAELAAPFVSFHAPMPATPFFTHQSAIASRAALRAALFEPSLAFACPPLQGRSLQRGSLGSSSPCHPNRVRGQLLGGNLSVLAALVGSRWAMGRQGTRCCCSGGCMGGSDAVILMLEDVNEEEYRVDRMVHQLLPSLLPPPPPACHATVHSNSDAASLRHVGPHQPACAATCYGARHGTGEHMTAISGLVLGSFTNFHGMSREARDSVRPVVMEQYGGDWEQWFWLGQMELPHWLPVLSGLPIGHTEDNRVAAIGALVEIDVDNGTLTTL
ncbi:hypothetical protein CLOM_g23365 [Closterium sp. NIES-68]|nr:hypothetical protein CLOM_g23365 [Closterium sp. NIES-68]GJP71592.1 hypothetical protein CLOP_g2411 [Closterium sp. NIES-67]